MAFPKGGTALISKCIGLRVFMNADVFTQYALWYLQHRSGLGGSVLCDTHWLQQTFQPREQTGCRDLTPIFPSGDESSALYLLLALLSVIAKEQVWL